MSHETSVDTRVRANASGALNIGSRAVHSAAQDSSLSTNPGYYYYGAGRYENFWTEKPFRGWVPDGVGGGQASSYSSRLALMGF